MKQSVIRWLTPLFLRMDAEDFGVEPDTLLYVVGSFEAGGPFPDAPEDLTLEKLAHIAWAIGYDLKINLRKAP